LPYYVFDLKNRSRVSGAIKNKLRCRVSAEKRNQVYGAHRYVCVNEDNQQFAYSKEDKVAHEAHDKQFGLFGA
jgi:hypothetical protein